MLSRSNLALAAILLIQALLLSLSLAMSIGEESKRPAPLLRDLALDDVDQLIIADDQGQRLSFARGGDGWTLPDADDFPANGDQVEELLEKIANLDDTRLIATNPANFARLGVADDDFRRALSLISGERSQEILLGGSGGMNTVYARPAGENRVYLGAGLSAWEASTQVTSWIDSSYVSLPQEDILALAISNAHGSIHFLRDEGGWIYPGLPQGETFEDTRLPGLLRSATSIRIAEPLGLTALPEYGLDDPAVTVEVLYRHLVEPDAGSGESDEIAYEERSYTLAIGAALGDGLVALKSSQRDYYRRGQGIHPRGFPGYRACRSGQSQPAARGRGIRLGRRLITRLSLAKSEGAAARPMPACPRYSGARGV